MIRILLVDDEALVRAGFRLILQTEPDFEVAGEAEDGESAIRIAMDLKPDVVLMDVRMPRLDGVEATRRLVAAGVGKILILTTFDLDAHLFAAIRAGASGFLLKASPPDDLVAAIRAVARGDALIEPRMTRRLLDEFARIPSTDGAGPSSLAQPGARPAAGGSAGLGGPSPEGAARDGAAPDGAAPDGGPAHRRLPRELDQLTVREIEVLREVGRGRSNAEIAERLYIGEATVKTHVAHILTKLGLRDRIQAVVFAYEKGLLSGTDAG
jgi:DNA-binding NarL/FixJ family response regulator